MTGIEPQPQQQSQHLPYPPPGWRPPAPEMSATAVVSFVFGILWLFWAGSIVAVITGHYARYECRMQAKGGDGLAVAGLILGYIGLATLAVPLLFGFIASFA